MRERPDMINGSVPMSDAKVREARSLSKLSNDAFGMVVNGMVKPEHAAAVGEAVTDTTRHLSMLKEMSEAGLQSAAQAKIYVGQALAAPQYTETTGSLFGEETQTRSLLAERTKVLDKALAALRNDKRIFGLLEREASNIESAGNRLSHEANAARATDAGQLSTLVEKLATTRGPVSDMLDRAARDLAVGKSPSAAARTFVRSVGDTMKQGGIAALTGEAAPMKVPVDPNQSHMFGDGGERPGWSDQAREASVTKRKGKAMGRAKAMMDSDLPPRKKIVTTPEAEEKWNKILQSIPQDDAEKKLRDRKAGERLGKNGSRPRAMADDDMFGGPSTKDKLAAKARQMEAKGRTGDPLNTGLFGSSKDQTDLVDMAKQQVQPRTVIAPDAHKYMKYAELHADGRMVLTGKGGQVLAERHGVSNAEFEQVLSDAGIRAAQPKTDMAKQGIQSGDMEMLKRTIKSGTGETLSKRHSDLLERATNAQLSELDTFAHESRKGAARTDVDFNRIGAFRGKIRDLARAQSDAAAKAQIEGKPKPTQAQAPATTLTARIGSKTVPVQSLEQVSQAYRKTISAANTGASQTPPLRLYDSAGNVVAHVSYNGKVWSGDVGSWKSGDQPLYEPGKAQIRDKPAVTKQSIMAEHKKGMARIEGKDARAAEIAKFTKMNGGRPQGSWSTRDLAANNRATIKERGGEMTYEEWINKSASDAKWSSSMSAKPHAITTKPPRDTPSRTSKKAADMAKIKGELHEIFARDSHGKQRNTKGELLPERKTGKKGTQNAANLEAINANRKANAKGKPAKPLMKDAEVKHLLKQGLVTREDVKSSASMADLKAKARQSATNMLRDRGMAMDDKRSVYQTIDEWVNSGKPLDAKPTNSRIGKTWTDGNGVTHTWTAESESAHQEWLARHSIGSSAETAGIKDPAAQMKDVFGPKMQPGTIPQMTPEGQAARYINRQRTSGSTKTDAELVAEFNAAPRTDFKSKAKSKFGKGMAVLAPLAIGAAALAAANDAKAEGLDEMGQVKAAGKAGAESTGALVAFTGATSLATAALVKGGMTLARATPIMQGVLMAGGAIHGALAAKPGERLIGALKGAWDMSLPGMVVNTGRDVAGAVSDRAALARTPQFDKANAAYEASHLATHTESPDASSDPNKKKGWSNSARISAYIARNPGGTALPYGGDRGKTSADAKQPAASTR